MKKPLDFIAELLYNAIRTAESGFRGVAKFGIALGSGPRGHGFESRHSDHEKSHFCLPTKVTFFNDIRSLRNG